MPPSHVPCENKGITFGVMTVADWVLSAGRHGFALWAYYCTQIGMYRAFFGSPAGASTFKHVRSSSTASSFELRYRKERLLQAAALMGRGVSNENHRSLATSEEGPSF